jgi:putative ABC transport system permease protein
MEGPFPFYGTLETEPESAASSYQQSGGALVDATVMIQFDIQVGDSIKVGEVTFPIAGALKSAP